MEESSIKMISSLISKLKTIFFPLNAIKDNNTKREKKNGQKIFYFRFMHYGLDMLKGLNVLALRFSFLFSFHKKEESYIEKNKLIPVSQ